MKWLVVRCQIVQLDTMIDEYKMKFICFSSIFYNMLLF